MRCLDDLPQELLRHICQYTLPQGFVFKLRLDDREEDINPSWRLFAAPEGHTSLPVYLAKDFR